MGGGGGKSSGNDSAIQQQQLSLQQKQIEDSKAFNVQQLALQKEQIAQQQAALERQKIDAANIPNPEQGAESMATRNAEQQSIKKKIGVSGTAITQPLGLMNAVLGESKKNKLGLG